MSWKPSGMSSNDSASKASALIVMYLTLRLAMHIGLQVGVIMILIHKDSLRYTRLIGQFMVTRNASLSPLTTLGNRVTKDSFQTTKPRSAQEAASAMTSVSPTFLTTNGFFLPAFCMSSNFMLLTKSRMFGRPPASSNILFS